MTDTSLNRIAEVIQQVIESEVASQLSNMEATIQDLQNTVEVKNEELVDDERVQELIRDFVNDGGLEITTT